MNEVNALREAQADMEQRHTAEVIELKKTQLDSVKSQVQVHQLDEKEVDEGEVGPDEKQMLSNLVKVKDEEIRQLKR